MEFVPIFARSWRRWGSDRSGGGDTMLVRERRKSLIFWVCFVLHEQLVRWRLR